MKRIATICLLMLSGSGAYAGDYCWNETVNLLIEQGDSILFTTDKTCPNFCQVDDAWSADAKKRAYATLMMAKAMEKPVSFFWNEHSSSCAGTLPAYSEPALVILN